MTLPKSISDVLSPAEVKELLTRLKVSALLHKKTTYRQITKETGAGAATIARIAKRINKCTGDSKLYWRDSSRIKPNKPTLQNQYSFGLSAPDSM